MEANQVLKSDILDIIFENRNKEYGAYDIRKKYRDRVNKSLAIAIAFLVLVLVMPYIIKWLSKTSEVPKVEPKVVTVNELAPPPPLQKTPPPPEIPKPPPPEKIIFTPPKIVKEKVLDSMPTMKELEKKPVVAAVASPGSNLNYTPPPAVLKVVPPPPETIYTTYDDPPVPPGGAEGYKKYLEAHIRFPQQANDANASGTVYISITVSKDGTLSDVHVEKDNVHYGCGDEAVRVIKGMPPWKPGKMNGVAVKVRYVIPVKFSLQH